MGKRTIEELKEKLRHFSNERNWNQFHSPKNLSMALIVEAAELLEHFQWVKQDESYSFSEKKRLEVSEEVADILIYLIRFADVAEINLLETAFEKLEKNRSKYPKDLAFGNALKSKELLDIKK